MKTVNHGDQAYEVLRNDLCKEDLCDSLENEEEKPIAGMELQRGQKKGCLT